MRFCPLLFATAILTLGAVLVRLASQQMLQVTEAEVQLEQTVMVLQGDLDGRCRDSHERLMAIVRWYIMRRSGQAELDRFEEGAWENIESQP